MKFPFQEGGGEKNDQKNAVAEVKLQKHGDHVHGHVNVQQQVIMSNDGVHVQIVRVVQVGPQQPLNIKDQMNEIEKVINDAKETTDENKDEDKEGEGQKTDEENKDEEKEGEDKEEDKKEDKEEDKKEDKEEDKEAAEQFERDINPRGKVLQQAEEEKQENAEVKEHKKTASEEEEEEVELKDDKYLENGDEKVEDKSQEDESLIEKIDKEQENKATENDNIEDLNKESNEDYDIVHSKTKKIKIEDLGIPNQATQKTPPQSIFRNLGPSRHRYTILEKDEL